MSDRSNHELYYGTVEQRPDVATISTKAKQSNLSSTSAIQNETNTYPLQVTNNCLCNDQQDVNEQQVKEANKIRKWKESPFAVGLTYSTWQEEDISCYSCCKNVFCTSTNLELVDEDDDNIDSTKNKNCNLYVNSCCFRCMPWIGRVGNMVVLKQVIVSECTDPITKQVVRNRPHIQCVVGPYWLVLVCVTIPFFIFLIGWTLYKTRERFHWPILLVWILCYVVLFVSLFNVSCRDPGIMYRYHEMPTTTSLRIQQQQHLQGNDMNDSNWIWNSQALTYRPKHALYDSECAVVIEELDHVCPWTGTAIGKKNLCWFRIFTCFVAITVFYTVTLLVMR